MAPKKASRAGAKPRGKAKASPAAALQEYLQTQKEMDQLNQVGSEITIADSQEAPPGQRDPSDELPLVPVGAAASSTDGFKVADAKDSADVPAESGSEYECKPDGELDPRPYSKMQKKVFDKGFSTLPKEIREEWETLTKPGGPSGKQRRKNELVNMCVPRNANYGGEVEIKKMTYKRSFHLEETKSSEVEEHGMSKTAIKQKYKEYFQEGIDEGDIWQGEDGLWYEKTATKRRKVESVEKKDVSYDTEPKSLKDAMAIERSMSSQCADWFNMTEDAVRKLVDKSEQSDDGLASDELMSRVQEAYDATTRLINNIKRTAQEIMAVTTVTEQGMAMVNQGKALIRDLSGPSEEIENVLTSNRTTIKWKKVVKVLQDASLPFDKLEKLFTELKALHSIYVPKPARAKAKACP